MTCSTTTNEGSYFYETILCVYSLQYILSIGYSATNIQFICPQKSSYKCPKLIITEKLIDVLRFKITRDNAGKLPLLLLLL